eukprot:9495311-Pyramimonas_sp.AAC.1
MTTAAATTPESPTVPPEPIFHLGRFLLTALWGPGAWRPTTATKPRRDVSTTRGGEVFGP